MPVAPLPGLKFDGQTSGMVKKETFWELLKRLDEESAQFNTYLTEANRYFDSAEKKTKKLLDNQEKQLHKTIGKVRKALREIIRRKDEKTRKN